MDIDKKLFVWVCSAEPDFKNPTQYRLKLDTFGNGWGFSGCRQYEGNAFFLHGDNKIEKRIKIGRETSVRKGVSWWLDVDSCPPGDFLLTEEKKFVCVYNGKIDFSPNESFSLQLKNRNVGQYLIRSNEWFGVLKFRKRTGKNISELRAFSFPEFALRSEVDIVSVDDSGLRGKINL